MTVTKYKPFLTALSWSTSINLIKDVDGALAYEKNSKISSREYFICREVPDDNLIPVEVKLVLVDDNTVAKEITKLQVGEVLN